MSEIINEYPNGNEELFDAIYNSDLTRVSLLLKQGMDIKGQSVSGFSPLDIAIGCSFADEHDPHSPSHAIVLYLKKHGAKEDGETFYV